MRLPHVADPRGLDVAIVGVPFDGGTSYRPGARLGPREIRAQSSLIRSYSYFQKVAPFDRLNVADVGDIDAPPVSIEKCYEAVEARHRRDRRCRRAAARRRRRPFDHAAGAAGAREASRTARRWSSSTRTSTRGTSISAASTFTGRRSAARSRKGSIDGNRFIQVGIRGPMYGEDDFDFHREHGITMIDIDQVKDRGIALDDRARFAVSSPGRPT